MSPGVAFAVISGAVVLIAVLIVGGFFEPRAQPPQEKLQRQGQASNDALSISARQLFAAYEENEIAADGRFKGKKVVVSGTVADIGKDIVGSPFLALDRGEYSIFAVQAMFPRSAGEDLAAIRKGQQVRARCEVSGKLGSVILRDCKLQ